MVAIIALGISFLFLMSSMSKEWSLPDLGKPTMYGAPFKDIVVVETEYREMLFRLKTERSA